MTIEMKPVQSSNIKAVGYEAESQTLAIQFGAGSVYHYSGVPSDVYDDLLKAESFGRFHAQNIKGKFEYERQADEKAE